MGHETLEKCKVLHFGRNNQKELKLLGDKSGQIKEIWYSNIEKDLGGMDAEDMRWKKNINRVANKANRMQSLLKRTLESKDPSDI